MLHMPFQDRLSASLYGLYEGLHSRRAVFFPQHPIKTFAKTGILSLVLNMAKFISGGSPPFFEPCYESLPGFFQYQRVLLRQSSIFGTQTKHSSPTLDPCDRDSLHCEQNSLRQ